MGAKTINRNDFDIWFPLQPEIIDNGYRDWRRNVNAFNNAVLALTQGKSPRIVFEHPGQNTLPASLFVCDKDGMVVTCGATTGYTGSFDLRHLWLSQKRIQGSHGANREEFETVNHMMGEGKLSPIISEILTIEELPRKVKEMEENRDKPGRAVMLVHSG